MRVCKELGYFCGLVIGDGSLSHSKGNYQVRLETTDEELHDLVRGKFYPNRASAIREAVRDLIASEIHLVRK